MTKAINPMLEKVAKAMSTRAHAHLGGPDAETLVGGVANWRFCLPNARIAAEALMEPDEATAHVGGQAWSAPETAPDEELAEAAAIVFRAMLQTILEEPARQPVPGIYSEHQHARNMGEI